MKEGREIIDNESVMGWYEETVSYYNVICQREIAACLKRRDLAVSQARKKIEESTWRKKKVT